MRTLRLFIKPIDVDILTKSCHRLYLPYLLQQYYYVECYISPMFLHPIMDISTIKSLNSATFCYNWIVKSICRFKNQTSSIHQRLCALLTGDVVSVTKAEYILTMNSINNTIFLIITCSCRSLIFKMLYMTTFNLIQICFLSHSGMNQRSVSS